MCKVRISSEVIRPFSGEGDVAVWMKKVKLVAKLQGISDVTSFMPLYLEGDVLALYLEMKDEDQLDAGKVEASMKEALWRGAFMAYSEL